MQPQRVQAQQKGRSSAQRPRKLARRASPRTTPSRHAYRHTGKLESCKITPPHRPPAWRHCIQAERYKMTTTKVSYGEHIAALDAINAEKASVKGKAKINYQRIMRLYDENTFTIQEAIYLLKKESDKEHFIMNALNEQIQALPDYESIFPSR